MQYKLEYIPVVSKKLIENVTIKLKWLFSIKNFDIEIPKGTLVRNSGPDNFSLLREPILKKITSNINIQGLILMVIKTLLKVDGTIHLNASIQSIGLLAMLFYKSMERHKIITTQ